MEQSIYQPGRGAKIVSSAVGVVLCGLLAIFLLQVYPILLPLAILPLVIPLGQFRNRIIVNPQGIKIRRSFGEHYFSWKEIETWKRFHPRPGDLGDKIWFKTQAGQEISLMRSAFGYDDKKLRKQFGQYAHR